MLLQPSPDLVEKVSDWGVVQLLSAALLSSLWIGFWTVRYLLTREDKLRSQLLRATEAIGHTQDVDRLVEKLTEFITRSERRFDESKVQRDEVAEMAKACRDFHTRIVDRISSLGSSGGSSSPD
jgi:hypothetical protein